jgi:hypothetical protein
MFGQLVRAEPIAEIKRSEPRLSVDFGLQRREAKAKIRKDATAGKLVVYAFGADSNEPQIVYPEILDCMICVRGGLPDHVGRLVSFETLVPAHRVLYHAIRGSVLALNEREFERWQAAERKKGKWPSQRSKKHITKSRGRPRAADDDLRANILVCLRDEKWTGCDGIPALRKILADIPRINLPSEDTLARIVRDLYVETGESGLLITSRRTRGTAKFRRYRKNTFASRAD